MSQYCHNHCPSSDRKTPYLILLLYGLDAEVPVPKLPWQVLNIYGYFNGLNGFLFLLFPSGVHQDNYEAMWFERTEDAVTGESMHVYKGGYWEAKDHGNWDMCPDIY